MQPPPPTPPSQPTASPPPSSSGAGDGVAGVKGATAPAQRAALREARTALRMRRTSVTVLPVLWPEIVSIVWFFAVLLAAYLLLGVVAFLFTRAETASDQVGITIIIELAVLGVTVFWCIKHRRTLLPALAKVGRPSDYLLAVVGAGGLLLINTLILEGEMRLIGMPNAGSVVDVYVMAGLPLAFVLLDMALYPGVVEELGFRGIIQPTLGKVMTPRDSIIATGLVFAFVHLSPLSMPPLFLAGLWLGYLRVRSGSLYPGMLAHFLNNGFIAVMAWYRFDVV